MTYQYVQPTEEQKENMQVFRDKFEALHKEIEKLAKAKPYSKGMQMCLDKLQEANMWLNKYITEND